ncbi:MAG: hypothetical protein HY696_08455 [Deltaproteobacteria bacterium]|nr:hypothetical protein [Deltaproteobacteria bacterium]
MGNETRRCESIAIDRKWWDDQTLGKIIPRLSSEAGDPTDLETCDVVSYYGITGQGAKDLFVGGTDDVRARLQQLETQTPAAIEESEVERWSDILNAFRETVLNSPAFRAVQEWLQATANEVPPRETDLDSRVGMVTAEYKAISGRLIQTTTADATTRTSTADITQLVTGYKQWIAGQRAVLNARLAQNNSFEMRSQVGDIQFTMRSSVGDIEFEATAGSGDRGFDGRATEGDQQFDIRAKMSDLGFDLRGTAGDLGFALRAIPSRLAAELSAEIDPILGPNLALALTDSGRILDGQYRPRHRLGYANIVAVLKTELPSALERLNTAMPGLLQRFTTTRAERFAAWERTRDTNLTKASQAGRDFETRMAERMAKDRGTGSSDTTSQVERLSNKIRADQQRIQGMIDALPNTE